MADRRATRATLANWRAAPYNRWAFHHVREIVPSADIPNDPRGIRTLPAEAMDFSELERFLQEADVDGFAIVHRGRLLYERYFNGMTDETPHILMSVSKAMLGLLAGLIRDFDLQRVVTQILPELEPTAYRGATIRHLLDMRAGIAFNEDYLATCGPMEGDGEHGRSVHYASPNTDLLGWVIERASGRRYAELMSEQVWKPAGTERSAYITVDRLGAPRCAGGMCATLRDMARVGQWMLEARPDFLDDLEHNGDAQAWAAGDLVPTFPGLPMRYRSHWYILEGAAPLLFGWGIHGQFLFVDRRNAIVVAQLSSQAMPVDVARIGLSLRAVSQIRQFLAHR